MTKRKPIAGTAALTKLQQKVLAFLMKHRFYNRQDELPTVLVGQWEMEKALRARQSEISGALKQLAARNIIEKTRTARRGETQLYTIRHPAHANQPDTAERRRLVDDEPGGEHQFARLRAAKAERFANQGKLYPDRTPRILRTGSDDHMNEAEAQATAEQMLREDPELEGPWEALESPQNASRHRARVKPPQDGANAPRGSKGARRKSP